MNGNFLFFSFFSGCFLSCFFSKKREKKVKQQNGNGNIEEEEEEKEKAFFRGFKDLELGSVQTIFFKPKQKLTSFTVDEIQTQK